MDDKLFDVFSEETEVPECVLRRVDETLEMIENSAESDRGYQKEEKTGRKTFKDCRDTKASCSGCVKRTSMESKNIR